MISVNAGTEVPSKRIPLLYRDRSIEMLKEPMKLCHELTHDTCRIFAKQTLFYRNFNADSRKESHGAQIQS